jgi:uncharacterized protein
MTTSTFNRRALLAEIRRVFPLDWNGTHGANHWGRVRHHALALAAARGADALVVELFAFLHDSQRENEWDDRRHGERGADYARSLQGRFYDLEGDRLEVLAHAIRFHSDGKVSTDATIQTCWDADRLDLGRVGRTPSPRFLSSHAACHVDVAYKWSLGGRRSSRDSS